MISIQNTVQIAELMQFSEATGWSPSDVLNRAVAMFMNIEAPVYLGQAKQRQRQQA